MSSAFENTWRLLKEERRWVTPLPSEANPNPKTMTTEEYQAHEEQRKEEKRARAAAGEWQLRDADGNLHPDYVGCPTCNGQGFRDEYSGDPEHGGETCYHCFGHGVVHRTEEENRPIDDLMGEMVANPTPETMQPVQEYFAPDKPERVFPEGFQDVMTGEPMDLAWRLLKEVYPPPNVTEVGGEDAALAEAEKKWQARFASEDPQKVQEFTPPPVETKPLPNDFFERHVHSRLVDRERIYNENEETEVRDRITDAMQSYVDKFGNYKLGVPKHIAIRTHLLNNHRQPDLSNEKSNGDSIVGVVRPNKRNPLAPKLETVMLRRSELSHAPQAFKAANLRVDKVINAHGLSKRAFKRLVAQSRNVRTGEPMDIAYQLLKFLKLPKMRGRQTTLPEFSANMTGPHGPVKYYHGTSGDRVPGIQSQGLQPNLGKVWVSQRRGVADNYAGGRSANRFLDEVMQPGGNLASPTQKPTTFGIREAAGDPNQHMGMSSFDKTVQPEHLVRMPPTQKPAESEWHTGKPQTGTGAQGQ